MSASARGARHVRLGEPNEDAHRAGHSNGRAIIAVADGHGSRSCPRADRGSRFAVDALFDVLAGDVGTNQALGETLVDRWRSMVEADLDADPPTTDEGAGAPPNHLLYGTTAVGVAADDTTITVVQIGDGDVLLGSQASPTSRRPIPPQDVNRPGETESLCLVDAASRVHVASVDTVLDPVDAVLVATDGLDNAFEADAWHDETMNDLVGRLVNAASPDDIAASLQEWCESPAAVGGDDTTIGLLVHSGLWPEEEE